MPYIKNIPHEAIFSLVDQIQVQPGQVVSKTLAQNDAVSVTLFAFAAGEEIGTHDSTGDAMVTVLEGVGQLLGNISMIREHLNEDLHISGVLLTMFDARTKLAEQVANEVREQFGAVVLGNVIPRSVRVSEAPGYGKTVIAYDPSSTGARAYSAAARELDKRGDYTPHPTTGAIGVSPEIFAELEG